MGIFRLCDLPAEDLLDERAGLGGLKFVKELAARQKRRCTAINFRHRRLSFAATSMYARRAAPSSAMSRIYPLETAGWTSKSAVILLASTPKRFLPTTT